MMHRRRFLTITGAALGAPVFAAAPLRWHGIALGAEVSIELNGPSDVTQPALEDALKRIRRVEALFSLYDQNSWLVRLNHDGALDNPPDEMLHLCEQTTLLNEATDGLFDPTVQVLWEAAAQGLPLQDARERIGWRRVNYDADAVRLDTGQRLTFNGIAQGFATDLVTDSVRAAGLSDIHVNIGEQAAFGPARRLGLSDPDHGLVGTVTLVDGAVATSSPNATRLGASGHIFSPSGRPPRWSTVSVLAETATLADGLSTALCLAPRDILEHARLLPGVRRIIAVDAMGDVISF